MDERFEKMGIFAGKVQQNGAFFANVLKLLLFLCNWYKLVNLSLREKTTLRVSLSVNWV